MSEQCNWRAKCDGPGHIIVRQHGGLYGVEGGFDVATATQLRDQLTAAIEEAKRQSDPFEKWWKENGGGTCDHSVSIRCCWVTYSAASAIWEAATKAAKEGERS